MPSSVAVLPGMERDVRTLDKLFDGVNGTFDDAHIWLCPFTGGGGGRPNVIYVWFDAPICLSLVRVWNYAKTAHRGTCDLQLYLDDLLLFDGYLKRSLEPNDAAGAAAAGEVAVQSIVLSASDEAVAREEKFLPRLSGSEQDVLFIDERRVVSQPTVSSAQYPATRPMTSNAGHRPAPIGMALAAAASAAAAGLSAAAVMGMGMGVSSGGAGGAPVVLDHSRRPNPSAAGAP